MNTDKKGLGFIRVHPWPNLFLRGWAQSDSSSRPKLWVDLRSQRLPFDVGLVVSDLFPRLTEALAQHQRQVLLQSWSDQPGFVQNFEVVQILGTKRSQRHLRQIAQGRYGETD